MKQPDTLMRNVESLSKRDSLGRPSTVRMLSSLGILLSGFLMGCSSEPLPKTTPSQSIEEVQESSGHTRMRQMLESIAAQSLSDHPLLGKRKLRELRATLMDSQQTLTPFDRTVLLTELGREELNANELQSAINHLEEAKRLFVHVPAPNAEMRRRFENRLAFVLGTAYLRLGETENCCLQHSSESCILPIQGGGIHRQPRGSQFAMKYFQEVLERPTTDPVEQVKVHEPARWLLNLAAMTLGNYPQAVPEQHRVPEAFFTSNVEFPRFTNIYPSLGLSTFNLSGSVIVDDFDNDLDLDILTCTYDSAGQMQIFLNQADGSFSEETVEWGLEGFYGGLTMVQADYDNDGDVDVFVPRGAWLGDWGRHPNSLLRNDGNRFTDVTFEAGLCMENYPTKVAAWADYDNDGDLDLYVGNESSEDCPVASQLFRNNGDSTFTNVASSAGVDEKLFAMGAVWGDIDDDRYPDLFVSAGGKNRLYHNNRDGTFTDIAAAAGVELPIASFPAWFWDFDNDGRLDLFVGASSGSVGILSLNIRGEDVTERRSVVRQLDEDVEVEWMSVYRGIGNRKFENVTDDLGLRYPALPMGANYGDLNQDGWPDFYLGTGDVEYSELMPNVMFRNEAGQSFSNITMAGGFGHLQKGHGVAFADLDHDGDQDVYIQMGGAFLSDKYNDALFENPGFDRRFLTLQLVGQTSNRSAIGARIRVDVVNEDGERSIYHRVNSGGSFGCNPLRCTLGLGDADRVRRLHVYWPTSDSTQSFDDVEMDQAYRIDEGATALHPLDLPRFQLSSPEIRAANEPVKPQS